MPGDEWSLSDFIMPQLRMWSRDDFTSDSLLSQATGEGFPPLRTTQGRINSGSVSMRLCGNAYGGNGFT
jgi:hypothetical protein